MKMKDRVMELLEQGYSAVYTESVVYGEFHELDIREIHQTIKDAKSDETDNQITQRLTYLRCEIEAERISLDEILELEALAQHIPKGDMLLLEWAGVPEENL